MKRLNYAGQVYGVEELQAVVNSVTTLRIAAGKSVTEFEHGVVEKLRGKDPLWSLAVNSGSSANLLAISCLFSHKLSESPTRAGKLKDSNASVSTDQSGRRAKVGDEVITVACGFPATIAPIIQTGLVPVFLDINIPDYNVNVDLLENAMSDKTVAVFLAHTLGNPFDLKVVRDFCRKYELWLIEDNCDSFGSRYLLDGVWVNTGTVGDISTMSFYPPHHITTGEGGMVVTRNPVIYRILKSLRDWGRDCFCEPGEDNACAIRFSHKHGDLPRGYDHKYTYSHLGYNLKMVEPCGALGVAQLKKLDGFSEKRKRNWGRLYDGLRDCNKYCLPRATENTDPSWFSFMLLCNEPNKRNGIVGYLERHGIQTRPLFSGNILKHPCFTEYDHKYRVIGELTNSDRVMNDGFMVGVYPGLSDEDVDYMIEKLRLAR